MIDLIIVAGLLTATLVWEWLRDKARSRATIENPLSVRIVLHGGDVYGGGSAPNLVKDKMKRIGWW